MQLFDSFSRLSVDHQQVISWMRMESPWAGCVEGSNLFLLLTISPNRDGFALKELVCTQRKGRADMSPRPFQFHMAVFETPDDHMG